MKRTTTGIARWLAAATAAAVFLGACAPQFGAITSGGPSSRPEPARDTAALKAPEAAQADDAQARAAAPAAPGTAGGAPAQAAAEDRMIVYNANISLAVENVSDSVQAVRGLTEGVGGMVAGSASRLDKDKEVANLTIRVPSSAFNQVMSGLRKLGVKVLTENGTARDVTEEFTDLDAQMRNLQVTEAQFQELMKRAVTIDDILKVQTQLTQVRGQIERLKGRMNVLQRTSDMATIVVNLSPAEPVHFKEPPKGWDPGRTVRDAWDQSWIAVTAVLDGMLRVAVFSWWLVVLAPLVWAVFAFVRRPRPAAPKAS